MQSGCPHPPPTIGAVLQPQVKGVRVLESEVQLGNCLTVAQGIQYLALAADVFHHLVPASRQTQHGQHRLQQPLAAAAAAAAATGGGAATGGACGSRRQMQH
jgi:hypothetical protein